MAKTPTSITIDIRTVPEIRQLLADVWDDGFRTGVIETTHPDHEGWRRINPYREEG